MLRALLVGDRRGNPKHFLEYTEMLAMLLILAVRLGQKPTLSVQKWSFHDVGIAFSGPRAPTRTAPCIPLRE